MVTRLQPPRILVNCLERVEVSVIIECLTVIRTKLDRRLPIFIEVERENWMINNAVELQVINEILLPDLRVTGVGTESKVPTEEVRLECLLVRLHDRKRFHV